MDLYRTHDSTPARERIDEWIDVVQKAFVKLEYVSTGEEHDSCLHGTIEHRRFASLDLNIVKSNRQVVERRRARRCDSEPEFFLFAMQIDGSGLVRQDNRTALLRPGDFVHYDTTRPYALEFEGEFRQIIVNIPRDVLRLRFPAAESTTAVTVDGYRPVGQMLRGILEALPEVLDTSRPAVIEALAGSVIDLVTANLESLSVQSVHKLSNLRRYHRDRIKAYVVQNLSTDDLRLSTIASALDMSISSITRAFESEPRTLTQMIWDMRLDGARKALSDQTSGNRSIKEIAGSWGFSDYTHFSRVFRTRFGVSPRGMRVSPSSNK
jgi:AraC-like DNA-binding protein